MVVVSLSLRLKMRLGLLPLCQRSAETYYEFSLTFRKSTQNFSCIDYALVSHYQTKIYNTRFSNMAMITLHVLVGLLHCIIVLYVFFFYLRLY